MALLLGWFTVSAGMARGASAVSTNHHSLWQATGPHCTVYLLGSIHFLKPENYPLAPVIEQAFTNAQTVVFETDLGLMEDPGAIAGKLMAKAMLPAGQTLAEQLTPATYRALSNYLASVGMSAAMFTQFKPGLVAMTLEATELQRLGFAADQGVDLHFYRLATKQGKKLVPLETIDFQLDLITGFSKDEGELMVKSTLDEMEKTRQELAELVKAWRVGDGDGTDHILNSLRQDAPAIYKRLLTDRNQNWLPKLEEFLAGDQNVIVIVGAGHLVGQGGVVELLKRKGVKIVQQ